MPRSSLKYSSFSTHIIDIQTKLSERAIELLNLPDEESCLVLDIGSVHSSFSIDRTPVFSMTMMMFRCGSGLSGEVLTDLGHQWVGLDISSAMLGSSSSSPFQIACTRCRVDVAQEREVEGDLVLGDIGYGMPFRAGAFDGAIR